MSGMLRTKTVAKRDVFAHYGTDHDIDDRKQNQISYLELFYAFEDSADDVPVL